MQYIKKKLLFIIMHINSQIRLKMWEDSSTNMNFNMCTLPHATFSAAVDNKKTWKYY